MNYDKEYFIKKFEAIPDTEIGGGSLQDCCVLHHCGVVYDGPFYVPTEESKALVMLFGGLKENHFQVVTDVNDGIDDYRKMGETPKKRILNKLKSL